MATLTLLSMARCRTDDIHHTAQLLWTDCIVGKTNGAHRDDVGDVVAFKAQDVGCRVHVSNQETGLHLITVKMIVIRDRETWSSLLLDTGLGSRSRMSALECLSGPLKRRVLWKIVFLTYQKVLKLAP